MNCFSIFTGDKNSKSKEKKKKKKSREASASSVSELVKLQGISGISSQAAPKSSPSSSRTTIPQLYKEKQQNLRVFTLDELRDATNGFNRMLKIGEGGFGCVFKGTINPLDGSGGGPLVVAIKKLNTHGLQGHKEWLAEVQFLGVVSHPNLVKLLGYCSADDHLFSKTSTLPWKTRLEIMLGAAQGLAYLHEGLEVKVIYRDFKSSNVLLDEVLSRSSRTLDLRGKDRLVTVVMYPQQWLEHMDMQPRNTSIQVISQSKVMYGLLGLYFTRSSRGGERWKETGRNQSRSF